MIDNKASLNVKHDDNGVFTDYSHKAANYGRDSFTFTLDSTTSKLFVGFRKPITGFYVDILNTDYTLEGTLTVEYWDGSNWVSVQDLADDTLGLLRSGFILFEREQANQVENEVDSLSKYWYRISSDTTRMNIDISGINMIFSDDYTMSLEQPVINDPAFKGSQASYVKIHASVRDEILQRFNNKDYIKRTEDGRIENLNVWDLHDILEVKQGATFLALSKIYYNVSDASDDVWADKSAFYFNKYNKMINIARVSLDVNDNGIPEVSEEKVMFATRRIRR